MGFGSLLRRAGGVVGSVARSPIGGLAKGIPGIGTALTAVGVGATLYGAMKGGSGGGGAGMPPLPAIGGSGGGGIPLANTQMGNRSIFRNDPNVIDQLKPWAISMRDLRQYFRAPKGFVIRKDSKGDPYGIPKSMAKQYLGWKAAPKPPISIRDWHSLKRAGHVIDKFKAIEKEAQKIANFHAPRRAPTKRNEIIMVDKGGKFVSTGKG